MPPEKQKRIEAFSDRASKWIGSTNSLIAHTIFFIIMLVLGFTGFGFEKMLLILTTVVSLEAIYLSIFIQMTVNKHSAELEEVSEDIEEIQQNVEDIQEDVGELNDEDELELEI